MLQSKFRAARLWLVAKVSWVGIWLLACSALLVPTLALTLCSMAAVVLTANWFSSLFESESGLSLMIAVYLGTVVGGVFSWSVYFDFCTLDDESGEVAATISTYVLEWLPPNLIIAVAINALISTSILFADDTTWAPRSIAATQGLAILSSFLLARRWRVFATAAIKKEFDNEMARVEESLKPVRDYKIFVGESKPEDSEEDDDSDRDLEEFIKTEACFKAWKNWFLSQPTLVVGGAATMLTLTLLISSELLMNTRFADSDYPFILLLMPLLAYFFAARRAHFFSLKDLDQFAFEVSRATLSVLLAFAIMVLAFCGSIDVLRCPAEPVLTLVSGVVFWLFAYWCYFRAAVRWSSGLPVPISRPLGITLFGLAALYAAVAARGILSFAIPHLASAVVLGLTARRILWMRPGANLSDSGFLLVLRPYTVDFNDYGSNSVNFLRSIVPFVDGRTISTLIRKIRRLFPLLIEQNASEILPAYDGRYSLRVRDRKCWLEAIEHEMQRARSCLMIVGHTPGAIEELKRSLWIARPKCIWLVLPEYEQLFRAYLWRYRIPLEANSGKDNFAGRLYQFSGCGHDGRVTTLLDSVMMDLSMSAIGIVEFCLDKHPCTNSEIS